MPNVDRANGLTPVSHISGSSWNGATRRCHIAAGFASLMFPGDTVKLIGSSDSRGYPDIELTAAGETSFGVVTAIEQDPSNLEQVHSPISTEGYADVCVDPTVVYEAQIDGAVAATDIGNNIDLAVVAGTVAVGRSKTELDYTSIATTATLNCKLIGLVDRENNDFGADAKMLVILNNHHLKGSTGNLGID